MKKKSIFLILSFTLILTMNLTTEVKNTSNKQTSSISTAIQESQENRITIKETKQSESKITALSSKAPIVYKKGDRGTAVKTIQQKLNKFGYKLAVDGIFGSATHNAVTDFQKRRKLKATGIVNADILKRLDEKPAAATIYKPPTSTSASTKASAEKYVNGMNLPSKTKYFIWVDLKKQKVNVFSGSNKKWTLIKSFTCSSGKASTPTIKGTFTVGSKGSYFIADGGARCKYYTQIKGNYLFHSVLYDNKGNRIIDGRLGIPLSHGCVRLAPENAKYIYDSIPRGTKIFIN